MEISIIGNGIDVDSALDAYVKRRIHFVLGRFSSRVERVSVVPSRENGPKGGMGRTGCFRARLLGLPTVAIEQADFDVRGPVSRPLAHGVAGAGRVGGRWIRGENP